MNELTEQIELLAEEADGALLLDRETLRKRYTAGQAEKIEWRRDACVLMLGYQVPAEQIASTLRMNLRTVAALASKNGQALAGFTEQFAKELLASSGGDFALADTKKHEANYLQLVTGAAIKFDKAMALKLGGGSSTVDADALEIPKVDEKLEAAKQFFAGLKSAKPVELTQPRGVESADRERGVESNELGRVELETKT